MSSTLLRGSPPARTLLAAVGFLFLGGIGSAVAIYVAFLRDLPDLQNVTDYQPRLASHVYDRNDRPIGVYFNELRRLTPYEQIPQHVVRAFVAGEDSTFFEHKGIDYQSILRAAWVNLRAGGEKRQGGSTITQQVVKGLLLTPERTYRRKIREMILARRIERRFSKQEILYLYLNQIYFGHGAYGIGEAALIYYGKAASELTVSEGAQLAGLPKAPSRYSPFVDPDESERRRRYVLERMLSDQFLDEETYQYAVEDLPVLVEPVSRDDFVAASYFTEEVRRYLFETLGGSRVLEGGLRIETTLDIDLQRAAVAAVRQGLIELDRRQGFRGMLRTVKLEDIPTELERIGVENRLVEEKSEDATDSLADAEDEDVEAEELESVASELTPEEIAKADESDRERLRETLREVEPLVGVVLSVDRETDLAKVGFAPDISAWVRLEDVSWARKPNPDAPPRPVEHIERIFSVGDLARFGVIAAPEKPFPEEDPAHGKLLVGLKQEPIVQGALLSIEVGSGDVLAMVGGYDFASSQFNRVTQARRQPGSAFKPLIYGTALSLEDDKGDNRFTPASIVHDRPKVYVDESSGFVWRPENYGRKFYGPITLRKALAKSVNNAAVHLCDEIGVGNVIDYAHRLGIQSPLERSLALALGSSEVSLLELTRAYAVYPSGGRKVVPLFIRRVIDANGEILIENMPLGDPLAEEPPQPDALETEVAEVEVADIALDEDEEPDDPDQLIPPEDAYLMTDMLRAVVQEGTGWRLRRLARPLAGKTGTTNGQADAWFMGFSPEITTGVWVGHDESQFLGWGETGSRAAAPIWVDYMRVALSRRPRRDFSTPESIVFTRIDRETGLLATRNSRETVFQAFIAGTEPTETADTQRRTADALRDLREDSLSSDNATRTMRDDTF